VLKAMGVPIEWAKGTLRLTTGRITTAQEIDRAATLIVEAVNKIRKSRKEFKKDGGWGYHDNVAVLRLPIFSIS